MSQDLAQSGTIWEENDEEKYLSEKNYGDSEGRILQNMSYGSGKSQRHMISAQLFILKMFKYLPDYARLCQIWGNMTEYARFCQITSLKLGKVYFCPITTLKYQDIRNSLSIVEGGMP